MTKPRDFADWLAEFKRRNNLPDLELEKEPEPPKAEPPPPPPEHWSDKEREP